MGVVLVRWLLACVFRALILAAVWVALAGWDSDYALYGLVSVAAATALSLTLVRPGPVRLPGVPSRVWGMLRLAAWFLGQAFAGGVDVALRAVRPTTDIAPAVVSAPFHLQPGPARELATLLMNLMPGTMVQRTVSDSGEPADRPGIEASGVELHTLSESLEPAQQWEKLQRRVADAYGVRVTDSA